MNHLRNRTFESHESQHLREVQFLCSTNNTKQQVYVQQIWDDSRGLSKSGSHGFLKYSSLVSITSLGFISPGSNISFHFIKRNWSTFDCLIHAGSTYACRAVVQGCIVDTSELSSSGWLGKLNNFSVCMNKTFLYEQDVPTCIPWPLACWTVDRRYKFLSFAWKWTFLIPKYGDPIDNTCKTTYQSVPCLLSVEHSVFWFV